MARHIATRLLLSASAQGLATSLATIAVVGAMLGGCSSTGFVSPPEVSDDITRRVGTFDGGPQAHLLLFPKANAEDLLGRAVVLSEDGGWTIADERAPGCEVRVRRVPAEFTQQYRADLDDLTSLAGGYAVMLGLQAEYGRSIEAEVRIDNTEIVKADTRGPCGDVVVDSVSVGRGERRLVRKAGASVEGGVGVGPVGVEGGHGSRAEVKERIRWTTPQAYAFTYREVASTKSLHIAVDMPRTLAEGDQIRIHVTANRDAYLVVFYLEEDGSGAVLWPHQGAPPARIERGQPTILGPLEARLRDPRQGTLETLVFYAFANEHDYLQLKPRAGAERKDGAAYAASLTERLSRISLSRWSRATVSYEIVPSASKEPSALGGRDHQDASNRRESEEETR